jgi:hypothetical protein
MTASPAMLWLSLVRPMVASERGAPHVTGALPG